VIIHGANFAARRMGVYFRKMGSPSDSPRGQQKDPGDPRLEGPLTGRRLLALACAISLGGCVFDSHGLRNDATVPADSARDASSDLAQDQGGDLSPDLLPDLGNVCSEEPSSAVCFFDHLDQAGTTGYCEDGRFVAVRRCYPQAPCTRGICNLAADCVPCPSLPCEGTCTVFFKEQGGCCVSAYSAGEGAGADLCEEGSQCRSGLCTLDGNCFQACEPGEGQCPGSTSCARVQISFANHSTKLFYGCKLRPVDGGPGDLVPRETEASPGDLGISEAGLGEGNGPDASAGG